MFGTAYKIACSSFGVLRKHRSLAVFPLLSLMTLVTALFALLPVIIDGSIVASGMGLAALFVVGHLIGNFYSAGLTAEALRALRGQNTSVTGGLGCVVTHLGAISLYSLISGTVGFVLTVIERAESRTGRFLRTVLGGAWFLVSYLSLPVMMAEHRSGAASLRRSGQLLRKTWGETAIAEVGARFLVFQLFMLILIVAALLSQLLDEAWVMVIIILFALAAGVVMSTLDAIYRAALYIFAAEGVVPEDFDCPEMHTVWQVKDAED